MDIKTGRCRLSSVLVWDLETVPDLDAVRRIHGAAEASDAEAGELLGGAFPKLPLHKIVCIGALLAERTPHGFSVTALGAPHIGQRAEARLISDFAAKIQETKPQLIGFNGHGFDLPVKRYRAMVNYVSAPGLICRNYFNRYSDECLDLCDALASFDGRGKLKLDDLCRVLGLPGKPKDTDGSCVAELVAAGRIQDVANYCETDVVNTYRVFLRYELFRGGLDGSGFVSSEENLQHFLSAQIPSKPHLSCVASAANENMSYLAYLEDEPMVWTQTFADADAAMTSIKEVVKTRNTVNGAGWGAVVDLRSKRILHLAGVEHSPVRELAIAGAGEPELPARIHIELVDQILAKVGR